ncbi:GNAT family N-acetyltransferase [Aureisphaera galaxeae]|uniref:GNAT family N-acetyltransferase n=1 Tax=Aureisphaera galaxeae TaxID=1538023 RepID=UPI00234FD336|nr:GNAT family N-acetyltransferase [Aureisphaera galaxeae]MDC8005004.1 GNAT family N-acetyltransferase [Aureisphaera galaxeae]
MKIIKATSEHLDILTTLFDGYRVFYKQDSDLKAAKNFLRERFKKEDSIIFLALNEHGKGLGFTQLYPSFSSVSMQRVYILNDLYVDPTARGLGVGAAIMERAKQFTKEQGAKGLTLETATDNPAQKLYERLGWEKDTDVFHYTWKA